jgi:hypothetical protein
MFLTRAGDDDDDDDDDMMDNRYLAWTILMS